MMIISILLCFTAKFDMWVHSPGVGTPYVRLVSSYGGMTRLVHKSGGAGSPATTTVGLGA